MEKLICEKCNEQINQDYHFCPYCGGAITLGAKELTKQKYDIIRLKLLADLEQDIDDAKALKTIREFSKKYCK